MLQLQKKNIDEVRVELQRVKESRDDFCARKDALQSEIDALKTEKTSLEKKISDDLENMQRFQKSECCIA